MKTYFSFLFVKSEKIINIHGITLKLEIKNVTYILYERLKQLCSVWIPNVQKRRIIVNIEHGKLTFPNVGYLATPNIHPVSTEEL